MINANLLRGKIAEAGLTQREVAQEIGMSEKTFSLKMKSGKFGLDEAQAMISLLSINDPNPIFFPKEVAYQATK